MDPSPTRPRRLSGARVAVLCGVGKVVIGCRSVSPRHFSLYQTYMRPLYRLLAASPQVTLLANSAAGAADYAAWLNGFAREANVAYAGDDWAAQVFGAMALIDGMREANGEQA